MKLMVGSLLGIAMAVGVATTPGEARACGGFFCNAQNPTPVIQAGERVLFAAHDGLVTMHIEITYDGDPTSFGWILPLAQKPMDGQGRLLPLDQVVQVSSQRLFPMLQTATDPSFRFVRDPNDNTLCSMPTSPDSDSFAQDSASSGDTSPNVVPPPVTVLAEANVGPYQAQLIEATRSDALYTWLGENGYIQDPKAQPILDGYVQKGFVFVGIRLQNGKSVGDLRPLSITLGENAPCVPLVLTSIAARDDMPILVWVLGEARAVPKNFLHAVVNDQAFAWPGAANYQAVLSNALDALGGRAWVTEFAGSSEILRGRLLRQGAAWGGIVNAQSLAEVLVALSNIGLDETDPDVSVTLRDHVPMPSGLTGYPNGNCLQCQGCEWAEEQCATQGLPNATHVTTEAEFYNFLFYWTDPAALGGLELAVDLDGLKTALKEDVVQPLQRLEGLFTKLPKVTRFYAMLSPDEMTRDPIFAFNPDLPDISNLKTATWDLIECGASEVRVRYEDGSSRLATCTGCQFGGGSIAGDTGVPALRFGEVLDESGAPVPFDVSQAEAMDTLVGGATLGVPTIPEGFEVTPPPKPVTPTPDPVDPSDPTDPSNEVRASGGCAGAPATGMLWAGLVVMMGLSGLRRRRQAVQ